MWGETITIVLNNNEIEAKGILNIKLSSDNKEYLIYSLGEVTEKEGKKYQKIYVSQINSDKLESIDDNSFDSIKKIMKKFGGDGKDVPAYENNQSITPNAKINVYDPKKIGLEEYVVKAMDDERVKYMNSLEEQAQQQAAQPAKFITEDMTGETAQPEEQTQTPEAAPVDTGVNAFNMSLPNTDATTVDTTTTAVPEVTMQETPSTPVAETPASVEVSQVPSTPVVENTTTTSPAPVQPTASVANPTPAVEQPATINTAVPTTPVVEQPAMLDTSVPNPQPVVQATGVLPENVKNAIIALYNLLENNKDKVLEAINKYEAEKNTVQVQQPTPVVEQPVMLDITVPAASPAPAPTTVETPATPAVTQPTETNTINIENIPVVSQEQPTDQLPTQDREFTGNTGPIPVVDASTGTTVAQAAPVETVQQTVPAAPVAESAPVAEQPVSAPATTVVTAPVAQQPTALAPVVALDQVTSTPENTNPAPVAQAAPQEAAQQVQPAAPVVETTPAPTPEAQPVQPTVSTVPETQPQATQEPTQPVETQPTQPEGFQATESVVATNAPEAPVMEETPQISASSILGEGIVDSNVTVPGGEAVDDPNIGLVGNTEEQAKTLTLSQ